MITVLVQWSHFTRGVFNLKPRSVGKHVMRITCNSIQQFFFRTARSIYRDHQTPICLEKIFLFSIIYTIAHKLYTWLPVKVYGCT